MSERRTYTLDDRAIGFLEAVPKDRNSQFISDLVVSFFEGKNLLSSSGWEFLSSEVRGLQEGYEFGSSLPVAVSESSDPVDLEKTRLRGVLSKLESLDFSSYRAFSGFLSLPEVRVGGMFDWTLGSFYQRSGCGYSLRCSEGWDFVKLISSSVFEDRPSDTLEFFLKEQVSKLKPDFDIGSFLKGLFGAVSSEVLRDLAYQEQFGLTYSEYARKQKEVEEAKKKKAREEAERRRAEEERLKQLKIDKEKADFISSIEVGIREKLSKSRCDSSFLFSRCQGKLRAGYFIDAHAWDRYAGEYRTRVDYSPVLCEKHLSQWISRAHSKLPEYTFITQE